LSDCWQRREEVQGESHLRKAMENPPKLKSSALIDPGLIPAKTNSTTKKPNRAKTFQKIPTTFLSKFYKTTNPTTEK